MILISGFDGAVEPSQTIKSYSSALRLFLEYVEKLHIEKISEKEISDYLLLCKTEKKYSFSAMKQTIASIRYLYFKVLGKPIPDALDLKLRRPEILPEVLSKSEIHRIIRVTNNLKHKTILLLIYSAGLRLGELLSLKIEDIDSSEYPAPVYIIHKDEECNKLATFYVDSLLRVSYIETEKKPGGIKTIEAHTRE